MRLAKQLPASFLGAMLLVGCASPEEPVEAYWTAGTDLGLYASLSGLGRMARAETGCSRRYAERALQRELRIQSALMDQYGAAAVEAAAATHLDVHPDCESTSSRYYRDRYEAVLDILEQRVRLRQGRAN